LNDEWHATHVGSVFASAFVEGASALTCGAFCAGGTCPPQPSARHAVLRADATRENRESENRERENRERENRERENDDRKNRWREKQEKLAEEPCGEERAVGVFIAP
jgi:hypothetical protein